MEVSDQTFYIYFLTFMSLIKYIHTCTHLHIDSPVLAPRDTERLSGVRILHIAKHQEIKEKPANYLHQLLVACSFTPIY